MLDIKLIRENPKVVKDSLRKRGLNENEIDQLSRLDDEWREAKQEADNLRAERNKTSERINEAKKKGEDISIILKRAKEIPVKIEEKEKHLEKLEKERTFFLENILNLVDKSVPVGDASKNKVLGKFG